MLATKTSTQATPRQHKPSGLTVALASAISDQSTGTFDPTLLDRLDAIVQSIQPARDLDQAIRLPIVLELVGLSKSTWYARLNPRTKTFDPRAPQPFKLGPSPNSPSVWWRSAVMAYLKVCASPQAWT